MSNHATHTSARDAFLDLACLLYSGEDHPERRERAEKILQETPSIATDLCVAAARGDTAAVRSALDKTDVTAPSGPRGWPPLLYLAYSRILPPNADWLGTAAALLEAGADPNTHHLWGGNYRFTALTGVFGGGEAGPVNQPKHPGGLDLARLLLRAGADPNDSQALYNQMFTPGAACLELLLAHGLDLSIPNNWVGASTSQGEYQLSWACRNGHTERALLLLAAGADPKAADEHGKTPWRIAWINGHHALAEILVQRGAETCSLEPVEELAGLCRAGKTAAARSRLAEGPELLEALVARFPGVLQEEAKRSVQAVTTLLDLGVSPDQMDWAPPLAEALWAGRIDCAVALLDAGADPHKKDEMYGGTPIGWARHGGHPASLQLLRDRALLPDE